jgi:formate hydrogenlyase subunit 3/multisubunit Na+/H+ antiporter MnhD subunit
MMNHWIMAPLLLPLLAGMLNLLVVRRSPGLQRVLSFAAAAGMVVAATVLVVRAGSGEIEVYRLGAWPAPFGIVLVLDRLSALLVLLTAVLALPTLLYATTGDDLRGRDFYVLFPLQLLGINGAFLTGDLFNLFVFFEILLIVSYCLALHGAGPKRTRHGLRYVVLNLVGSSLFLIALGTIYGVTGSLNMADVALKVAGSTTDQATLLRISSLMLLTVFGLKAAILSLYLWLPALYAAVTPCVAALYYLPHTTLTTAGLFLLADLMARQRGPASDHFCPGPPLVQPTCLGVLFLIAAAASTGLPPLSGFIGKLLLMQAMEPQRAHWLWAVVLAGGLAGLVAWSRAGSLLFWETEGSAVSGSAAAVSRLLPVIVLVSISVPLTLFAAPITRYAEAAAVQLLAPQGYITAVLNPEKSP